MIPRVLGELPSTLARLDCSGQRHAIRWEAGELVALDHADPEGERALVALGGARTPCIEVLSAWARQMENADLLSALSRGTLDLVRTGGVQPMRVPGLAPKTPRNVVMPARMARPTGQWVSQVGTVRGSAVAVSAGGGPVDGPSLSSFEEDIVTLAGLGQEMTLRLVATATALLLDRLDGSGGSDVRPALETSLFGRALTALRTWLAVPDLEVELTVADPADAPSLAWDGAGPAQLTLPLDWVVRVWGRGLAVVAGRFGLSVVDATSNRTILMTVASDLGSPRRLVIEVA
jgi:hypothetical protein